MFFFKQKTAYGLGSGLVGAEMFIRDRRYLLNRADAVATVSETTAALIREKNLTTRPLTVIPNAPQPGSLMELEQALEGAPQRNRDLLYMGSFMPYKNVETLLRAMKYLPDYRLHLLSKIAPAREQELAPLLGENVQLHRGVSEQEYRTMLAQAAALLTASRDEGYGLPVVEAQSAGCPVVLSDIPIFREIAPSAPYAPADDAYAFAQAVRALEDSQYQQQVITQGLQDAARYSWEASALTLIRTAQGLLAPDTSENI